MPSPVATVEAVGIGLLIPALSSVIPIKNAVAKSLIESLNTARSTIKGKVVTLESKRVVKVGAYVIFGLLCVVFGITVYIVLPEALLAENADLILKMFFLILLGMILGITLVVANLDRTTLIIMMYLLLFWERKSMRALIKKNLVVHLRINKLTFVIYSLTIGCVIFLFVSLDLVIKAAESLISSNDDLRLKNADIALWT